jgi:hypothetical protein
MSGSRSHIITPVDVDLRYMLVSLGDLELLHHYSTATYSTLTDRTDIRHLWRTAVPLAAFEHDFLLHSMLSVAALHLATEQPNRWAQHMDAAIRHHNLALPKYRSSLDRIDSRNCSALFACSTLVVVYALGFSFLRAPHGMGLETPVLGISDIFALLRGSHMVLREAWQWIEVGEFGALFEGRAVDQYKEMPPAMKASFRLLEEHNDSPSVDPSDREVYEVTIRKLRECFIGVWVQGDKAFALSWPILVEPSYIVLLDKEEPMALAILAHYAVVLDVVRERWWSTGWGEQLLLDISQSCSAEWQALIAWPLEVIGERSNPFNS